MVMNFLRALRGKVGQAAFNEIVDMAEKDIKFNKVGFGKVTSQKEFITVVDRCYKAFISCEVQYV